MGESEVITTDVDKLMDLLRTTDLISITEAAKKLNMPIKNVEALADLLEEEKMIKVSYKFTTPYLALGSAEKDKDEIATFDSKKDFYNKAKTKGIPDEKIETLWKKYIDTNLDAIKYSFYEKAKVKGLPSEKIDGLWQRYYKELKGVK